MFGQCERALAHTRQIICRAYRRSDGLWEIEARLSDEKAEDVGFRARPTVAKGEFMHRMALDFLIDTEYRILDVRAHTQTAPWPECGQTDAAYHALVGLSIGPGFKRRLYERLGGTQGCTHISHLVNEVANTYLQASWPERVARQSAISADPKAWPDRRAIGFVNQCHAWRKGGDALRREYPSLAADQAER